MLSSAMMTVHCGARWVVSLAKVTQKEIFKNLLWEDFDP